MKQIPTKKEVEQIILNLNENSAAGQDEFLGKFFQTCWEIIGNDVWNVVRAFFSGCELPKYITHTNLVLIPKKEMVENFRDLGL